LEGVAGVDAVTVVAHPDRSIETTAWLAYEAALARRVAREPVARILGERGFYGRLFRVTPATLDPRPETEAVVETVLRMVKVVGLANAPLRLLDVGTGSGILLVTLLAELPAATGLGTDISQGALDIAAENALRHGVAGRAQFLLARSLDGVTGAFDVIVSNPPYIPSADIADLEPEVRAFDPPASLDGGPDGMAIYQDLAAGISGVISMVSQGIVALEVGIGQADAVQRLMADALGAGQIAEAVIVPDLGGVARCVAFRTRPGFSRSG
jgi:release factor glutamine methyltransferase